MDSMADSLKDGYCCEEEYKERNSKITTEGCNLLGENLHNKEEKKETIHFFQLNVRYAPIEVFIKYLILMENDQKADMNIKYIVNCLSSKPKHCLFISLVSLLKEVILWDPRHLKSFDQYDGLHIIFTGKKIIINKRFLKKIIYHSFIGLSVFRSKNCMPSIGRICYQPS